MADDFIDPDLIGAQASDPIRRTWDIQDAASRACVTRRHKEACKAALTARRRNWQSVEIPEGDWVMVWRKYDEEGGMVWARTTFGSFKEQQISLGEYGC